MDHSPCTGLFVLGRQRHRRTRRPPPFSAIFLAESRSIDHFVSGLEVILDRHLDAAVRGSAIEMLTLPASFGGLDVGGLKGA